MRHLRVKNWDEYQRHKKGSRPEWICIYPALLNPGKHPRFHDLSDGAKLTLHHVRLLAADCGNIIPESWLNKTHLNMQTSPKIDEIVSAGFAEWRSSLDQQDNLLNKDKDHLSLLSSPSPSPSFDQEVSFSELWGDFLSARVPDPKHKPLAKRYFFATVRHADDLLNLKTAIANYRVSKRVAKGFVQDASTFMHDWQSWIVAEHGPTIETASPVDELREWASARAASLMACERGGSWHHEDITESEFRAYWNWQQTERGGQIESDGVLNDYAAFVAAQKESA